MVRIHLLLKKAMHADSVLPAEIASPEGLFHAARERHASASLHPRQHKLRYDVKSPLAYLERVEKMRLFSLGAHMILTQDSKKRTTAPVAMMRAPSGTKYLGSDMVEALCVATVASEQGHGVC